MASPASEALRSEEIGTGSACNRPVREVGLAGTCLVEVGRVAENLGVELEIKEREKYQ